jgi:hypothetical protein
MTQGKGFSLFVPSAIREGEGFNLSFFITDTPEK